MTSTLRKAFWPAMVVAAMFALLAVTGSSNARPAIAAEDAEVTAICGPELIHEGNTYLYAIIVKMNPEVEDDAEDVLAEIDDRSGDSDITSATIWSDDDENEEYVEFDNPTDFVPDVETIDLNDTDIGANGEFAEFEEFHNWLKAEFKAQGFNLAKCLEVTAKSIDAVIKACLDDFDSDTSAPFYGTLCNPADWSDEDTLPANTAFEAGVKVRQIAAEVLDLILAGEFDCGDIGEALEDFLLNESVGPVHAENIGNDIQDLCEDFDLLGFSGVAFVDVTCNEAGMFDLSASLRFDSHASSNDQIEVQCVGDVDDAEIVANPTTVEIVPARGSTFASLVTLSLSDSNGDPAGDGVTVVWTTDRCRLSSDKLIPGKTANMITEALKVFALYNKNSSQTSLDINAFVDALDQATKTSLNSKAYLVDTKAGSFAVGDVISAVILDCSATNTTPGIAKVMACIDISGADICKTVNVTVVGPPVAPVVLTTDQTNVRCGERVQITATIKDAAGQNVSDHTLVEVATNAGGVLGGTGAIAGEAGLVSPVSSTVAETNNGVATFWLITSELHQGVYTVLVTTGGGGSVAGQLLGGLFSTPPVSGSVTVTCGPATTSPSAPSAAATVRPPSTGQGITPPSTGDAGLADASGNSWALFVIAGLTVFALAGVASLKFARR